MMKWVLLVILLSCVHCIDTQSKKAQTFEERCLMASAKKENAIPDIQKQTCIVTAYDKVRGFLNWPQVNYMVV